jgi:hypothetical protein
LLSSATMLRITATQGIERPSMLCHRGNTIAARPVILETKPDSPSQHSRRDAEGNCKKNDRGR